MDQLKGQICDLSARQLNQCSVINVVSEYAQDARRAKSKSSDPALPSK